MDGDELAKLRKLTGQLNKLTYEAAKADMVAELPHEEQLCAGNARTHALEAYSQRTRVR
jgi:hypothetical protein